jgi:hypothetical protein
VVVIELAVAGVAAAVLEGPLSEIPVALQDAPASVLRNTSWPPSSVSVARKTSFFSPPASHGRSPSWHCIVPVGHVLPPSGDENRASLARLMPVS